jgi:hypothetical protein
MIPHNFVFKTSYEILHNFMMMLYVIIMILQTHDIKYNVSTKCENLIYHERILFKI